MSTAKTALLLPLIAIVLMQLRLYEKAQAVLIKQRGLVYTWVNPDTHVSNNNYMHDDRVHIRITNVLSSNIEIDFYTHAYSSERKRTWSGNFGQSSLIITPVTAQKDGIHSNRPRADYAWASGLIQIKGKTQTGLLSQLPDSVTPDPAENKVK